MMVIYHSRGEVGARLAAAVHLGLLPESPPDDERELSRAWELVSDPDAGFPPPDGYDPKDGAPPAAVGLRLAGEVDGDRVFTLGRRAPADVVRRAFSGVADVFGLDRDQFVLVPVETGLLPVADSVAALLCRVKQPGVARRLSLWRLRTSWEAAGRAVRRARKRDVH